MERKSLSLVLSSRLVHLIENEFESSRKTDSDFAAYASEKLGVTITKQHVWTRRTELGLPSAHENKPLPVLEVSNRLEACERQLAADAKEFRGLAAIVIDLQSRVGHLERVARLKGTFEAPQS